MQNENGHQDLWVVVPAFNETQVIGGLVRELKGSFDNVVVIDDSSADSTLSTAVEAGAWGVPHPVNLGQGAALQTGISFALSKGAQYIATFDADGQHRIDDLKRMFEVLLQERCDIVLGSRFSGSAIRMPMVRRYVLKCATAITNWLCGVRLTDTHNGLRVFTRHTALQLDITQNRMAHASEIVSKIGKLGLDYREIPITVVYSDYSIAKGQKLSGAFDIVRDVFSNWLLR